VAARLIRLRWIAALRSEEALAGNELWHLGEASSLIEHKLSDGTQKVLQVYNLLTLRAAEKEIKIWQ